MGRMGGFLVSDESVERSTGIDIRTLLRSAFVDGDESRLEKFVNWEFRLVRFSLPPLENESCPLCSCAGDSIMLMPCIDFAKVVNSARSMEERSHITVLMVVVREADGEGIGTRPSGSLAAVCVCL